MNIMEVGNFVGGELVFVTWWVGKLLDGKMVSMRLIHNYNVLFLPKQI